MNPATWTTRRTAAVLALLVVQFVAVGLWEAARDTTTVDEAVDVASGISIVTRHDFRMNPEHGPLPKVLSALPALAAHPVVPDGESWHDGRWFDFTADFVQANRDAGRLDRVLFAARLVPTLVGAACGLLLFVLGRRLFGTAAGLLAAGAWLTAPVFVGFAHFAMIDVPFTATVLLVALALDAWRTRPTTGRVALLGAALAAALLTRHSALALAAAVVVTVAVLARADRRRALTQAALVAVVAFAGVTGFFRLVDPTPPTGAVAERFAAVEASAASDSLAARAVLAAPFPPEYRAGFAYLVETADQRPAYLLGQAWDGSRPWFFPAAAVVKLPLPTTAVLVAGLVGLAVAEGARRRRALVVAGVPALVTLATILAQPLNLGLRYAFAPLALALVLASGGAVALARAVGRRGARGRVAVAASAGVLALGQIGAAVAAAPHSLAWAPTPFTPAYRWMTDSNVDFGQDVDALGAWVRDHAGGAPVHARLLRARGVPLPDGVSPLPDDPAGLTGWVAVSATELTARSRDGLAWLRGYCPVGTVGGSIMLYRFTTEPTVEPGPTVPARPCPSGVTASVRD